MNFSATIDMMIRQMAYWAFFFKKVIIFANERKQCVDFSGGGAVFG